jgi:hypothetical protein
MFERIKLLHNIKIIGHMTAPGNGMMLVTENGSEVDLIAQGWK